MSDRREQILERLKDIALALPDIQSAVRNRGLRENEQRPAACIMDGDENQRLRARPSSRGPELSTHLVAMAPEIWFLEKEDRPLNRETGLRLNAWRIAFCKAVGTDSALRALLGSNGAIEYNGTSTDLHNGDTAQGLMQINMTFVYPFDPIND